MQTFDTLKTSVGNERTVDGRVSSMISGFTTLVEQNKGNPAALSQLTKDINANKQTLVHSIVSGAGSGPEK